MDHVNVCVKFEWPHPYSTLIFGVLPLYQIAHLEVSPNRGFKLFGREIIFEVFQPVWKTYLNVTDRRTDDCVASRGKNLRWLQEE